MAGRVTQCPQCDTSFRVTEAQLQIASGSVRCGSCLHVFKADENWQESDASMDAVLQQKIEEESFGQDASELESSQSDSTKSESTESDNTGKFNFDQSAIDGSSATANTKSVSQVEDFKLASKQDKTGEDDTVFSDDSGLDGAEEEYEDIFLDIDEKALAEDALEEQMAPASEIDGESWAKDLLDDEGEEQREEEEDQKQALLSGELKTFAPDELSDEEAEKEEELEEDELEETVFEDEEEFLEDEAEELSVEDDFIDKNDESEEQAITVDDFAVDNTADIRADLGLSESEAEEERDELFEKIEPAPIEMEWQARSSDWLISLKWIGIMLLLAVTLIAQYAWINFEELSREKQYRALYSKACVTIGCELPDTFNPDAIRSSNLVIRSHPQMNNVLVVDAMLQNTASYEQLFPELELYFSDLNGFPVASRRFRPDEYLAGELSGKKIMPSAKAIHISLDIVDPGRDAVNYRLQISERIPSNTF